MQFNHEYYWFRDSVMQTVRLVQRNGEVFFQCRNGEKADVKSEDEIIPISSKHYKQWTTNKSKR